MSAPMVMEAPRLAGVEPSATDVTATPRPDRWLAHPSPAWAQPVTPAVPAAEIDCPAAPSDQAVVGDGHLREAGLDPSDRGYAVVMHLGPLAFIWIGPFALAIPLVMWLVRKDESRFVEDHGREIVNFMISLAALHVITAVTIIGLIAWPVLWVVAVVSVIRGSIAAGRSQYYRYPMTLRFLT